MSEIFTPAGWITDPAEFVPDERGEITVRFTVEALTGFLACLSAADIRSPYDPNARLTFHAEQSRLAPGTAAFVEVREHAP